MSTSKGNDENVGDSAQASDEGLLLVPPKRRDSTIWRARRGTKATKFDFYSPEDIERAAEYLGLTSEELRAAVDEFERADHIEPTSPLFLAVVRSESDVDSLSDQFEDADVRVVMRSVLEHDISDFNKPIVSWSDIEACCALDLDCPPGGVPLTDDELESIIDALLPPPLPKPLAVWRTHGGGLRLLFVRLSPNGEPANALAGVWHLTANLGRVAGWHCEAKTDTRHPAGERDGLRCGRIHWFEPSENTVVLGESRKSVADEGQKEAWLDEHGMAVGKRYEHTQCPFSSSPSGGNPPVVVYEWGVKCFKCESEGRQSSASWDSLCGDFAADGPPDLFDAAKRFVHVDHQLHVLRALRPATPESLLGPAWGTMLRSVHHESLLQEANDAESGGVVTQKVTQALRLGAVPIARSGAGTWLDTRTLDPRKQIGWRTMSELPWCRSKADYERALDTVPLEGFVGLHPVGACRVLHPRYKPPPGSVLVRRKPQQDDTPPVELGSGPPTEREVSAARDALEAALPGVNIGLLLTLITVGLDSQEPTSGPPFVVITGPTGSAKNGTVYLAGAALGERVAAVHIDADAKTTRREIGGAVERGACLLLVDEVGRERALHHALKPLLALNTTITFDRKFENERTVRMEAAIALAGSNIPKDIFGPEMCRRSVGFHLPGKVNPPWDVLGADIANARTIEVLQRPLDVLTRWVWWQISDGGPAFRWRDFAFNVLGALPLDALDTSGISTEERDSAIRILYEMWRTAPATAFRTVANWGPRWLDASPRTAAGKVLSRLVDFEAELTRSRADADDLQRLDLAPILGFQDPSLQLLIRRRSSALWLLKFNQTGVLKGRETPREHLPSVSVDLDDEQQTEPDDDSARHCTSQRPSRRTPPAIRTIRTIKRL